MNDCRLGVHSGELQNARFEHDPLAGEGVDVRGRSPGVPGGPEVQPRQVIGDDQEQVGSILARQGPISLDSRGAMPGTQGQQARNEGEPDGQPRTVPGTEELTQDSCSLVEPDIQDACNPTSSVPTSRGPR